jgi:hypothetical protein
MYRLVKVESIVCDHEKVVVPLLVVLEMLLMSRMTSLVSAKPVRGMRNTSNTTVTRRARTVWPLATFCPANSF